MTDGLVWPYVYGYDYRLDMTNLRRVYTPNPDKRQPIRFFCRGDSYEFWGLIRGDLHLICPAGGRRSCSCSAATGSAAICCRASSTARASR